MKHNFRFTIFTPIYNRIETIDRVWRSLNSQTYKNFEWIVVDDGSTDGVWELLKSWEKNSNFHMTIIKQINMGKHVAWNRAVEISRGELFIPADSDDSFAPNALELFDYHWDNSISFTDKINFSGINVLCKNPITNEIIGTPYPYNHFTSNSLDLFFKYKIIGEKWGCIRTDILRTRPFKEVKGSYLNESWIWFHIARQYKILCINQALREYYTNSDICLSKPTISEIMKLSESRYTFILWHLNENFDYIAKYESILSIIKKLVFLWKNSFLSNINPLITINECSNTIIRLASIFLLIPSYILYKVTYIIISIKNDSLQ